MILKNFLGICGYTYLAITDSNNIILYSEDPNEEIGNSKTLENLEDRTINTISSRTFFSDGFDHPIIYIKLY